MIERTDTWHGEIVERSALLVDTIRPLLAGEKPEAVGSALGELAAIFIAGHHPMMRDKARQMLFDLADSLVPIVVEQMIDAGHASKGWRK